MRVGWGGADLQQATRLPGDNGPPPLLPPNGGATAASHRLPLHCTWGTRTSPSPGLHPLPAEPLARPESLSLSNSGPSSLPGETTPSPGHTPDSHFLRDPASLSLSTFISNPFPSSDSTRNIFRHRNTPRLLPAVWPLGPRDLLSLLHLRLHFCFPHLGACCNLASTFHGNCSAALTC